MNGSGEAAHSAVPVAQSVGRAELPQPGLSQPGDPSQGHVHTTGSPLQPPQDPAGPRVALSHVDV